MVYYYLVSGTLSIRKLLVWLISDGPVVADRQSRGEDAKNKEWLRAGLVLDIVRHRVGQEQLPLEVNLCGAG